MTPRTIVTEKPLVTRKSLVTSPPVVMAPRPDGFEVVWGVGRLSRGWVEWQRGDETGVARADAFGLTPQSSRVLRVRLSGFAAGDSIRFRTVTEALVGPRVRRPSVWKEVKTLDPAADTAHIAVWNDTHERGTTLRKLHTVTPPVDMLLWNGDLCNDWKKPDAFTRTVLSPEQLDISEGRPLSIVLGNHDVRGAWAYKLAQYVAMPEQRPYSASRIGPVAVIQLHTGEDKPDDHPSFKGRVAFEPLRAEQAAWLREVTARPEIRDAPYRIVFCHIPLRWTDESPVDYGRGGYDWFSLASRDAWHDALVEWGAQLIVSGHTHEPVYIPATDGFPYAQVVGGGPARSPKHSEAATWIEITADADELSLTSRYLNGRVVETVRVAPIGEEGTAP